MILLRLVYGVIGLAGLAFFIYAWRFFVMFGMYGFYGVFINATFVVTFLAFLYTAATKKYPLIAVFLSIILAAPIFWETWQSESKSREFCKGLVSECAIENGKYICPSSSSFVGMERICNEYL